MQIKMIKYLFFLFIFQSFSLQSFSQGWYEEYPTYYGGSGSDGFALVDDGAYLIGGSIAGTPDEIGVTRFPGLIKTNLQGDTLWTKAFEIPELLFPSDEEFIALADGNFLLFGYLNAWVNGVEYFENMYILKTDADGNYLWHTIYVYDSEVSNTLTNALEDDNGNIFILGHQNEDESDTAHQLIHKFDAFGMHVFTTVFETNGYSGEMIFTTDNKLAIASCRNYNNVVGHPFFSIVNPETGEIEIEVDYNISGSDYSIFKNLVEMPDGDFVVLEFDSDSIALRKLTPEGVEVWSKKHLLDSDPMSKLLLNEDGTFLVATENSPFSGGGYPALTKITAEGDSILWTRALTSNSGFEQISAGPNNGYIMTGNTYSDTYDKYVAYLTYIDSLGNNYSNLITGHIYHDTDVDCLEMEDELHFPNWVIRFAGTLDTFYTYTNQWGNYLIDLEPDDYEVVVIPPSDIWQNCDPYILELDDYFLNPTINLPVQTAIPCPVMSVNVGTSYIRGCQNAYYDVEYCNEGSVTAEGVYLEITLDSAFTFVSSSLPLTSQDGLNLTFELADIGIYECVQFSFVVYVDCEIELGQTHCVDAHIYPDEPCVFANTWSGASIKVSAECIDDETVRLAIENIGDEAMNAPLNYFVIEDEMILYQDPFNLGSGDVFPIDFSANGSTFRIEAEQEPDHPGFSMPSAAIEGCGGFGSLGYINWYPQDDTDLFLDVDCLENVGSYDPNDKLGLPRGYGDDHYIDRNTLMSYRIRFQNTGTDTAFLVVVRDTLSEYLDITTFERGASSFPYELTFENVDQRVILVFTFEDIDLLPEDWDEAASIGFVDFKIKPIPNLPLETIIENRGGIYFDQNPPIITNTVFHTIGENYIEETVVDVKVISKSNYNVIIHPNPFLETTLLTIEGDVDFPLEFKLYDISGQLVREINLLEKSKTIERKSLTAGFYVYKIMDSHGLMNSGKIMID